MEAKEKPVIVVGRVPTPGDLGISGTGTAPATSTGRLLPNVIAQLRHLYRHLKDGSFNDASALADGLLSPQIAVLESIVLSAAGAHDINHAAYAFCQSGKFECGLGRCAPICAGSLGHRPKECPNAVAVHGDLVRATIAAQGRKS